MSKSDSTNKFDIKKFESKRIYNKTTSILEVNDTLKDSTTIKQYEYKEIFVEQIQALNSPIVIYKAYFKNTGNLKTNVKIFFSFAIGNQDEYNQNGKLIKQTNWDKNYSFSVYDLAAKLKKEFNIDIMHTNQVLLVIVVRGYENVSYYEASIGERCMCKRRLIRVDANSGQIISDKV